MHTLDAGIEIGANPEAVWSILADFDAYPQWNPFLRSIEGELRKGSLLELDPVALHVLDRGRLSSAIN